MKREILDEISFQIDITFVAVFLTTFFAGRIAGWTHLARVIFLEDQGFGVADFLMLALRSDTLSVAALAVLLAIIFVPNLGRVKPMPIQTLLGIETSGHVFVTEGGVNHAFERSDLYRRIVALPSGARISSGAIRAHDQCRIAHELAHSDYRDYLMLRLYAVTSLVSAFSISLYLFQITLFADHPKVYFTESLDPIVQREMFVRLLIPLLTIYRTASFLWRREFRADRRAASVVGKHKYLKYIQFCINKERLHVSNTKATQLFQRILHPTFLRRQNELTASSSAKSLILDAIFFGCLAAVVGGSFFLRFPPLYRNPRSCGIEESDWIGPYYGASCGEMWASALVVCLVVVVLAALTTSLSRVTLSKFTIFWSCAFLAAFLIVLIIRVPLLWEGDAEFRQLSWALALPFGRLAFLQNYGFVLLPTAGASVAVWIAARVFAQPILISIVLLTAAFAWLAHSVYINPIAFAYQLGNEPSPLVLQTFQGGVVVGFLNRWTIALSISLFVSSFLSSKFSVAVLGTRK